MCGIPIFGRYRQEDQELKVSLGYTGNVTLSQTNKLINLLTKEKMSSA